MKKYISSLILFLLCCTVFAQADSTGTGIVSTGNWLADNWEKLAAIAVGIYELVVRYFPTSKNLSILSIMMKIIQSLVPNKDKEGNDYDKK